MARQKKQTKRRTKNQAKDNDTRVDKHVRITLELTESFVRKLTAKVNLSGINAWLKAEDDPPLLDAAGILALLVYAEARGAHEEQIALATPHEWREELGIVHDERRVYEVTKKRHGRAWDEVSSKLVTGPKTIKS